MRHDPRLVVLTHETTPTLDVAHAVMVDAVSLTACTHLRLAQILTTAGRPGVSTPPRGEGVQQFNPSHK